MGGSTTISNMQPAAGNLRVQTSVYGAAIPLVYGTARVSGNLLWFGGFQAIAHTTTTSSGGKGGGSIKQVSGDYTYQAAAILAIGEGPFNNVLTVWKGKTRYGASFSAVVPSTVAETITVPGGGIYTVANGGTSYLNDVQVTDTRAETWDSGGGGP